VSNVDNISDNVSKNGEYLSVRKSDQLDIYLYK